MKEKCFVTADLYLAAAVVTLLRVNPALKIENGRVVFIFPASDELFKAMNAFNNGIPVSGYEYAQTIKRLRAEMMMRRNAHVPGGDRK